MIRRLPPTAAQRRRRVLGALIVVVVTLMALRGLGTLDAGTGHRPGPARGARPAGGGPVGAVGSARGAGPATGGPMGSPPRAAAVTRTFFAAGGPVIAVVTEKGAPLCEVDLLDAAGALLAQGWARGQPVTLHAVAVANAPVSLVLRPTGGGDLVLAGRSERGERLEEASVKKSAFGALAPCPSGPTPVVD